MADMENIRINRLTWTAAAVLIATLLWGAWQNAGAHNIGWKWDTSNTPVVTNHSTSYGSEISSANADYNSNTDLTVYSCNTPCNESIKHRQSYVGDADWAAVADSYGYGSLCNDEIDCN